MAQASSPIVHKREVSTMQRYKNLGRNSNVAGYEFTEDSITVHFNGGAAYLYTHQSAGEGNIETMKLLATRGRGLSEFINRRVKTKYARRIR
jgi:hypothetical protein